MRCGVWGMWCGVSRYGVCGMCSQGYVVCGLWVMGGIGYVVWGIGYVVCSQGYVVWGMCSQGYVVCGVLGM